jgi:hypothetical protein
MKPKKITIVVKISDNQTLIGKIDKNKDIKLSDFVRIKLDDTLTVEGQIIEIDTYN